MINCFAAFLSALKGAQQVMLEFQRFWVSKIGLHAG